MVTLGQKSITNSGRSIKLTNENVMIFQKVNWRVFQLELQLEQEKVHCIFQNGDMRGRTSMGRGSAKPP